MRTLAIGFGIAFAAGLVLYGQAGEQTFGSPDEAAQALLTAASANDTAALLRIFGPAGKDIIESGDAAADKAGREHFSQLAHQKMKVEPVAGNPNRATLIAGPDDWPFPVPLVRKDGKWFFDRAHGSAGPPHRPQRNHGYRYLPWLCGSADGIRFARPVGRGRVAIRAADRQHAG